MTQLSLHGLVSAAHSIHAPPRSAQADSAIHEQACLCTSYLTGNQSAVNCWVKRGYGHD